MSQISKSAVCAYSILKSHQEREFQAVMSNRLHYIVKIATILISRNRYQCFFKRFIYCTIECAINLIFEVRRDKKSCPISQTAFTFKQLTGYYFFVISILTGLANSTATRFIYSRNCFSSFIPPGSPDHVARK